MDNEFLKLLYIKEFDSRNIIDRVYNYFRYRKFLRKLRKEAPSFDRIWQFVDYLKWVDIIYGFTEEQNSDIDLLKKRNPYSADLRGNLMVISFTINVDDRSRISFRLDQENHMIDIEIARNKISTSDDKTSSISFSADDEQFVFAYEDQLMICEINRILQDKMVKYMSLFYNRIR